MLSFLQLRYMDTVPCDMSELTFGIFYSSGLQPFVLCIHTNQHQNFTAGYLAVSCSVVCRQLPQPDPVFTWDECCVLLLKKRRALLNSANLQALFFFFFNGVDISLGLGCRYLLTQMLQHLASGPQSYELLHYLHVMENVTLRFRRQLCADAAAPFIPSTPIICSTLMWIAVLVMCNSGGTGSPLDQGNDGAEMGFQTVWDYHQHRPRQETNVPCSTSSGHRAVKYFGPNSSGLASDQQPTFRFQFT